MRPALLVAVIACRARPASTPDAVTVAVVPADAARAPDARPPWLTIEVAGAGDKTDRTTRVVVIDRPGGARRERELHVTPAERRWIDYTVDGEARRVDLHELILDASPAALGARHATATRPVVTIPVEAGELAVELSWDAEDVVVRELAAVTRGPVPWAKPLEAGQGRVLGVSLYEANDVGLDTFDLPVPPRVRDVSVVAVKTHGERTIGRCRCVLGKMASPYDGEVETCDREQQRIDVAIYAAATGKRLASRRFLGPEPSRCTKDMNPLDLVSKTPGDEVEAWISSVTTR